MSNTLEKINIITADILRLSLEIKQKAGHDIFVWYYPHCDLLEMRVYIDGWDLKKEPFLITFSFRPNYINKNFGLASITKIQKVLSKLLTEGSKKQVIRQLKTLSD